MIDYPAGWLRDLLEITTEIQQIPAPTFAEGRRADYLLQAFSQIGLAQIHRDETGNVLGSIPGLDQPPLVITAHMDTVHPQEALIQLERQPNRMTGRAIGDNSLGLAGLLHLGRLFVQNNVKLPGPVWFVGSVGEEGLGNLIGMQAIVNRFKDSPIAYLVLEGIGFGNIYHRGLAVARYNVTARTAGGHSWADYGSPSAIHELAAIISKIVSMHLPDSPRTSLNFGVLEGGISINTIAAQASTLLDIRSEDASVLAEIAKRVAAAVQSANRDGIEVDIKSIGSRPSGSIPAGHPLVKLAQECITHTGTRPRLGIASTEANVPLSYGYPSICIGLTTGGNVHTELEYIDISPIYRGMQQFVQLSQRVWEIGS